MEQDFPGAGKLAKGYHRRQVAEFLEQVELGLRGTGAAINAADVRRVGFDLVRGGYDVEAVDSHLDVLEERVLAQEGAGSSRRAGAFPTAAALRRLLAAEPGHRLPRCHRLKLGYAPGAVDRFLELLPDALEGAGGIGVDEVRRVKFRPRRGGYSEEHVDDLLDQVVDAMLRRSVR
jgi:DivIVA domain-containing protein